MKTINHYLSKVLLGASMLAMILFAYSCSQETSLEPAENLEAHSAKSDKGEKATRAIRAKLNNAPAVPLVFFTGGCFVDDDPTTDENEELIVQLTTNDIFGNMTHLGKLQPGSLGEPIECNFNEDGTLQTVYLVNYIGAHGDEIRTRESVTLICGNQDCSEGTFEGTIEIVGGTGRFEGAEGNMVFVDATFVGPNSSWELVGRITY